MRIPPVVLDPSSPVQVDVYMCITHKGMCVCVQHTNGCVYVELHPSSLDCWVYTWCSLGLFAYILGLFCLYARSLLPSVYVVLIRSICVNIRTLGEFG